VSVWQAQVEESDQGLVVKSDGWFVLNGGWLDRLF
jgi:hypothetical protein